MRCAIRAICLAMSDEYIDSHFEEIKSHGSDIEARLDDSSVILVVQLNN